MAVLYEEYLQAQGNWMNSTLYLRRNRCSHVVLEPSCVMQVCLGKLAVRIISPMGGDVVVELLVGVRLCQDHQAGVCEEAWALCLDDTVPTDGHVSR